MSEHYIVFVMAIAYLKTTFDAVDTPNFPEIVLDEEGNMVN